ncbi:SPOC like C-terminal domain-containing protein, partial [Phakopsora pachyrhizi]
REITIYCIDVSPTMREKRTLVEIGENDEVIKKVTDNLEYGLEVVKGQVSSMLLSGLKTVHCGIVLFGTDRTKNSLSDSGYQYIWEYVTPSQPTPLTLLKINNINKYLTDSEKDNKGDILSALIYCNHLIGETLGNKRWTRKVVLITDAMCKTDWSGIKDERSRMRNDDVELMVVGIDFDDPSIDYREPFKTEVKSVNEVKLQKLCRSIGNSSRLENALISVLNIQRPQPQTVASIARPVTLTLGFPDSGEAIAKDYNPDQTLRAYCLLKKCTSVVRPMAAKKIGRVALRAEQEKRRRAATMSEGDPNLDHFTARHSDEEKEEDDDESTMGLLRMERKYFYVDKQTEKGMRDDSETDENDELVDLISSGDKLREADPERLVKAYKYGDTRVMIDKEDEERIRKTFSPSLQIRGFVKLVDVPRHHFMNDVNYLYPDPGDAKSQITISAIVRVLDQSGRAALARYVGSLGSSEPKMVVLIPVVEPKIRYFLFIQVPFAEDLRDYFFPPLQGMRTSDGKTQITQRHTPTDDMQAAMDELVDKMELVEEITMEVEGEQNT